MLRKTKIVATIGPSSETKSTLRRLVAAGMDVARLNFSHGSHQSHAIVFQRIRSITRELNTPITIIQDLQGPKFRIGNVQDGCIELQNGRDFFLTNKTIIGNSQSISFDIPELFAKINTGNTILIDDGQIEVIVLGKTSDKIHAKVIQGGVLKSNKGISVPGLEIGSNSITEKDYKDLIYGCKLGVDFIAVSYVQSEKDIESIRELINKADSPNSKPKVIAKIETRSAINHLRPILQVSDGVMVARGDLGVEMPPESVPINQKEIIREANKYGRICITATQMLESMIHNPRPTRAEASDIANAIFDGTDAIMLSGETAIGDFPIQSVSMMNTIAQQAELNLKQWGHWEETMPGNDQDDAYYVTRAAKELAQDRNVAAIAVFTKSGRTALLMSKRRPEIPIFAFTPSHQTYSQLNLMWGVSPYFINTVDSIGGMVKLVESTLLSASLVCDGQQVVLICGFPINGNRPTNMALLHTIGSTDLLQ